MKQFYFLLFVICLLLFTLCAHAQAPGSLPPYNLVQGKLLFNQSYCGGARPTDEMVARLDSLRLLPNTTVCLARKQGGKFIYKLTSDANGNFKRKIRAGKYFIYMSKLYDHDVLSMFNPNCAKWMKYIFGEVEIIDGGKKLYNIPLHFGCDPCLPPKQ